MFIDMSFFQLFIINAEGKLIYTRDFQNIHSELTRDEQNDLMVGFITTLCDFCHLSSPTTSDAILYGYKTDTYALHYWESPTLFKFIITTVPNANSSEITKLLSSLYLKIYVPYVIKNPFWNYGKKIEIDLFTTMLDKFIENEIIV
ncbi:Trafficking protein particle complex subunit 1 [Intoshia linei]|uniref:Trafficking protein particle complex subunit n=1 Tax=Intoshia linei TaxID=1819745 RepID=A0A177B8Z6_9BILA|nr:Trafficking protein particle complex subunit 1 [Intoshia linei]